MYKITLSLLIFFTAVSAFPDQVFKWTWFGGDWEISEKKLTEKKTNALKWDYYELINYNTILSSEPVETFSEINYSINIKKPYSSFFKKFPPAEQMTFFSATSPHLNYYYHILAVKFTGSKKRIDKISFIRSDIKNTALGYGKKFNFFVEEISSSEIDLEYDKKYDITIKINNPDITVFIDGKKTLSSKLPEESIAGKFGFSSRNASIEIGPVKILNADSQIIFQDDFSENSIYIPTMKAGQK